MTKESLLTVCKAIAADLKEYGEELPRFAHVLFGKYLGMLEQLANTLPEAPPQAPRSRPMDSFTRAQEELLTQVAPAVVAEEHGPRMVLLDGGPGGDSYVTIEAGMQEGNYTLVAGAVYQLRGQTLCYDEEQTARFRERLAKANMAPPQ